MKVIIFGIRPPEEIRSSPRELQAWYDKYVPFVEKSIEETGLPITVVISGRAEGFDKLGEMWAESRTPQIPVLGFPANWRRYGARAGHYRNEEMGIEAHAGIGFWDRLSHGTRDMIQIMQRHEKPVYTYYL